MREQRERREHERKAATQQQGDPNLIPLGTRVVATKAEEPLELIPDVEWWDAGLLHDKSYELVDEEISNLREDKVTIYIEHPIPLEPPAEEPQPPPMPLPLIPKVGSSSDPATKTFKSTFTVRSMPDLFFGRERASLTVWRMGHSLNRI